MVSRPPPGSDRVAEQELTPEQAPSSGAFSAGMRQSMLNGIHTMDFNSLFSGIFEQIMTTITDLISNFCQGGAGRTAGWFSGLNAGQALQTLTDMAQHLP